MNKLIFIYQVHDTDFILNLALFQLYKVAVQKQNGAKWYVLRRYKEFYDLYQTVSWTIYFIVSYLAI